MQEVYVKKMYALKELLFITQYKFSMICVTETWLNDTSPLLFDIDNYSLLNVNRKGIEGGGVAIYCKSGNFRAFRGKMVRRENKTARILCRNVCLRVQACCPRN